MHSTDAPKPSVIGINMCKLFKAIAVVGATCITVVLLDALHSRGL
jgi:hypothetical protein